MADVFGMAARLVMQGEPLDRLLQGLDDEAKRRLAFLALASCDAYPVGWLENEGPPPPLDVLPSYPVRMHVEPGPPHQDVRSRVHILLTACKGGLDGECMTCGAFVCPYGEPLHFHHDGCPACTMRALPPPSEVFDPDAIQSHEEARDSWALEASLHERVGEFLGFVDPDEAKAQDELDQHRDQDGNRTTTEAP